MPRLQEYRCSNLCYDDERMFTGTFSIQVLGIDKHSFYSHTGNSSHEINFKSSALVCLPIGSVYLVKMVLKISLTGLSA